MSAPSARVLFELDSTRVHARFVSEYNMSAFKRKRGRQALANKKAKKVKYAAEKAEAPVEADQERTNEVTIPPPVSSVSARACYYPPMLLAS